MTGSPCHHRAMSLFLTDEILPPAPDGAVPILHDREYRVRAYRLAPDRLLLQGAVRDQKPPGLYIAEDPDPLTIHHMQLSLTVAFPELVIVDAVCDFESHPFDRCPTITGHYRELIGLSIARGFTHKVRELFGGPNGCTHTTAMLQAMAPVAVQCFWSMQAAQAIENGDEAFQPGKNDNDLWRRNINTCHVWAEDGELVAARERGETDGVPVFLRTRLAALGIDPNDDAGA
jgi:hypothetical protein